MRCGGLHQKPKWRDRDALAPLSAEARTRIGCAGLVALGDAVQSRLTLKSQLAALRYLFGTKLSGTSTSTQPLLGSGKLEDRNTPRMQLVRPGSCSSSWLTLAEHTEPFEPTRTWTVILPRNVAFCESDFS